MEPLNAAANQEDITMNNLEVLVEKVKDANQAIFVDNQFTDLLKVVTVQAAPKSTVQNVIALRG